MTRQRNEAAVETVARVLAYDIMSGVRTEGSRLPVEDQLALELGVGRSTVREAVKILSSKGLLDVAPKRGTTVRSSSKWHQLDPDMIAWRLSGGEDAEEFLNYLAEIRAMVEPFVAEQAARRRSEADVERISAALRDMNQAAVDSPGAVEADIAFHFAVVVAAGNPLLLQLTNFLEPALRRSFDVHALSIEPAYLENLELHQQILNAIARSQPRKAADASRRLIQKFKEDRVTHREG